MKAVILAAGRGARLNGGAMKPKCLMDIGGASLLRRQIDTLRRLNVPDIVVVIGFGGEQVRRDCDRDIRFVENVRFAETNSLYSLWMAREHLGDGFVVLNGDVLFHDQMLARLLASGYENALLISDVDHQAAMLGDEEMKVKVRGDLVVDISKEMDPCDADGENVGIVKFGPSGARHLIEYMDHLIARRGVKDWAPRAFLEFARRHPLHAVSTGGLPWTEIDFPEDYQRAVNDVLPRIEASSGGLNSRLSPPRSHTVSPPDES